MASYGHVIVMIAAGVAHERHSETSVGVHVALDLWMRMVRHGLRNYE
jgi:hypothetical protein